MDTDGDRTWTVIALLAALVLLRAWFSACETALTEINDAVVHARAEEDKAWKPLDRLISQPTRMRRCFSMHRIFSALFIGILCWLLAGQKLTALFPFRSGSMPAALLLTFGLMLLLAVFTDMFPKRAAKMKCESFARLCVPTVRLLMLLLTPFWAAASGVTALLCRLCRIPAADSVDVVTEEEIRLLVDAGNETGGIEESQREMINNIFTFDDVPVSDVMTHRRDITAVPKDATATETAAIALRGGYSRIPVYENSIDTVVGIVLVKDLLPLVGKAQDCSVSEIMREASFVPDSAKCRDVFQQMRRDKIQLAIVADEYGGTAGMVTMEDLLEEIVGNIQDEYDDEESEFTELSEGVYSIAGAADPEDILPKLGVKFEADDEYDTMSAFVVHLLGRIPEEGEKPSAVQDGVRYTLLSYEDNWISRIQAELIPDTEKELTHAVTE
ncbi:MAG: hemolysin family protein [Oscillospiraceae bacterium]|nr:HlyC/CorC family transporter [Oscillospiraceae bacterium]MCR4759460.1 hemolysin family protein [Oscillospiraceae bacterium]